MLGHVATDLSEIRARFALHVNVGPHAVGSDAARKGCHLWTGAKNDRGYGIFGWSKDRTVRAHRAAYELAHGDPGVAKVMHKCDNPPCVRVDHLHTGTQRHNMFDRRAKGRWAGGRRKILTTEQGAQARRRSAVGESIESIAKSLGVSRTTVRNAMKKG